MRPDGEVVPPMMLMMNSKVKGWKTIVGAPSFCCVETRRQEPVLP
jgi:hypothetical protein